MKIENISVSNINLTDNSAKLSFTLKELTKNVTVYLKINDSEYVSIFTNKTNSVLTYNLTNLRRGANTLFLKLISTDEEYISEPIDVKVKNNASVNNLNCSYSDSTGKYILDFTLLGDAFLKYKISINIDNVGYKQILEGQIMGDKSYEGSGLSLGSHKCKIKANDGHDEYESSEYSFEVKNHKPYLSDIAITDIKNSGTCTVYYGVKDIETTSLTHSIVIDGTKKTITPTKTNDFYSYAVTGLGVGKHTMYVSISDKTDVVNSSTVTIELFQSSTNTKRLLEIAKLRYDFSYQQLKRIIETTISDGIFNYETENDVILKSQTYYKEMYAEFNRITLTSIDKIGNTKITKAKSDLNKEIDDVYGAIDTLENTMETTFKDGVLSDSEKDTLRNSLNLVAKEKVDIDKDYTNLYNNKDLTGTPKTNLKSTYDTFVSRHNTLVTTINNLINKSGIVDNTDKTNLDTAFTNWRTALGNYRDASMNAIDAIARKKVDDSAEVTNKYWSEIILEEGGIQSRVGSLETKVTGTGGIDERLRSAEQKITTDGITNLIKDKYYTKEVVDSKLAEANVEFEIGGRNLISNSAPTDLAGWKSSEGWTLSLVDCTASPKGKAIRATVSTANSSGGMHKQPISKDRLINGKTYTLSAWVRASKNMNIKFYQETMTSTSSINVTTAWQYFTFTSKIDTSKQFYSDVFYINNTADATVGTWIEVYSLKLEKGTKATDWTPSVEETDESINKNKTEIETTKESVAKHTTALNNITSRVSTTESNITKINGNITSVTERISTAEQKITEGAITSTVSKNFYTKEQVDAIEIGGRNLVMHGNFPDLSNWGNWGSPKTREIITKNKKNWCHIVGTGTAMYQGVNQNKYASKNITIESDTTYTFSCKAYGGTTGQIFTVGIHWKKGDTIVSQSWHNYTVNTNIIDIVRSYVTPSDVDNFNIMLGVNDSSKSYNVYFTDVKLEKGTKATDWTPALEDTQTQIENLNSTITQTANSWSAKITQNEKDIASLKLTDSSFDVAIKSKADTSNIISKINASTEGITISSSKINISGYVTFSELSTSGKTTINGGNITTGTIDASKVTVKNISASNITSGTIDASKVTVKNLNASNITSGTLDGSKANISNINASNITTGTLNASNINVTNINGTNISRGTIDASKVTVKNLNASNITSGTLSGDRIKGGTISASKEINFVGGARIFGTGGSYGAALTVSASEYYFSGASYGSMKGSWSISGSLSIGGGISASSLNLSSWLSCNSVNCASLSVDGSAYIGSAYINGSWVTSDKRLKTDIKYVNKDTQSINPIGLVSPNVNITTLDMHEFVETLPMVSYRLIDELNRNMDNTHYGFLAQEILYTKVGSELIAVEKDEYGNEIEGGYLRYSQDKYISFICGALQEEIKQRKQLEQKILELEERLGDNK